MGCCDSFRERKGRQQCWRIGGLFGDRFKRWLSVVHFRKGWPVQVAVLLIKAKGRILQHVASASSLLLDLRSLRRYQVHLLQR